MASPPPDARVQSFFRQSFKLGREVERVGPFLASFDRSSDSPYLSYAIPDDGAAATAADVQALAARYVLASRRPRLEYLPSLNPRLEQVLVQAGFTVEARPPVMTATPETLGALEVDPSFILEAPRDHAERQALADAFASAFGMPAEGGLDVAWLETSLAAGAIVLAVRECATGRIIGGGTALPPRDGLTEVAGIGILAAHRRRGLAGALTAELARRAFSAGVQLALISPGSAEAGRVYTRAGFEITTQLLHISR